jgi:hypothetical protein
MDRKEFFARGLEKIMLRIKYDATTSGYYSIFATANTEIIKHITGSCVLAPRRNNIMTVYDIKNNLFMDLNLDLVHSVELYGLPFHIFPEYIFNIDLENKITQQELFDAQIEYINKVKQRGDKLTAKGFLNNYVDNDVIQKIFIIKNAYKIIKEKLDNIVYTFDESDKQKFLSLQEPDLEEYEKEEVERVIAFFEQNFPNIFDYVSYVRACEVCELPIKLLNDSSEDIMTKCINIWKQKIQQHALDSIKNLTEEEEAIKTHGNEQDLEELTYIKELITNVVDEVDFSQFKTPKQLFSFWPSLLLPAPNYVVSIR